MTGASVGRLGLYLFGPVPVQVVVFVCPDPGGSLVDAGNSVDNLPGESWRKARRRTEFCSAQVRFLAHIDLEVRNPV